MYDFAYQTPSAVADAVAALAADPEAKALAGGELKGMTKNLIASRQEVTQRMVEEAEAKGADAILAMRFDTSEMGGNWTEICAYGTAVKVRKI